MAHPANNAMAHNEEQRLRYMETCETILRCTDRLQSYLSLRNETPEEIKLYLWVDRLQIFAMIATEAIRVAMREPEGLTAEEKAKSKSAFTALEKGSELIVRELQSLCLQAQGISTRLNTIENKLNAVLEGPDYPAGKEAMESAGNNFRNLASSLATARISEKK